MDYSTANLDGSPLFAYKSGITILPLREITEFQFDLKSKIMKNSIFLFLAIVLSGLFFLNCFMFPEMELSERKTAKTEIKTTNNNGFAIVELFTSEGCSSCPPADELMAKLQRDTKGMNIYFLAYHVDYWDRLGWKDQFSSAEFTNRQQQYQDWLNLYVMYTPQFIINGTAEFAGYNETALSQKITDALKTKQTEKLELIAHPDKDSITIHFKTNSVQKDTKLFIATILRKGISKVQRGENKGNTLNHVQIVKELKSYTLGAKEGNLTISKPKNFNATDWQLIGFIQNTITGKIYKTTKADLN
ncbi:DUF1223 domain-containing protein [Flavobacterium sp. ANB]|uniref:DUF1223 domain-containing protein n=1 Tax=unclassified Flavobacterium TaxID=196869 RepID=UPI0012B8DD5F|nr:MULTISPECIES: DUF1223 domain-containing protein [unclassified Flavobacterium]MBF4515606.1 DUF1223 domain-containing protein [Flavobacterium sp. ANB]MTD68609.1 DUF1223 domain-containing protein [Flavobacterium sp. LC2016-13]